MLREVGLEPAHALLRPLLDPRLREVVLDPVEDAAIPWSDDRPRTGRTHEPFGPSSGDRAAQLRCADGRVPDRQSELGRRRLRGAAGGRAASGASRPTCSATGDDLGRDRPRCARRTRSRWRAATVRSPSSRRRRSSVISRSPASRSGRATTSRVTSGSTATTRSAALDALVDGREIRIDVGRANDRLFLNNVSLGVYARLVHRREHHRRRSDAFARLRALGTLAHAPARHRHHRRRGADRGARRARLEQRVRRSTCCRSASASGSTRDAAPLRACTASCDSAGTSVQASRSPSTHAPGSCRRRSTASRSGSRRRSSSAIERQRSTRARPAQPSCVGPAPGPETPSRPAARRARTSAAPRRRRPRPGRPRRARST